ncbi:MAG: hypothetical protein HFG60_06980 [Lachnospiraceae bacterium]|nr:hypothetical protein [Lachnospiraceae bacterium]MCI9183851.1 hypothetical protein [Lachnospiraceae bacterium]
MKEKWRNRLVQADHAVILAGLALLSIGLYYCVIKAGIPFHDAPLELRIRYAIHMEVGEVLVKSGFLFAIGGGIGRLALWLSGVKKRL